ncbi:hypothetical protein ACH427_29045 [Streptomyces sp. NPDC020379]|uniref:hypothetical protein n=1 Tax=Streptomyces sp. NPDC020379 TaxID=3365071 RepID=UPI0037B9B11F
MIEVDTVVGRPLMLPAHPDISRVLGVTEYRVREAIKSGDLPSVQLGNSSFVLVVPLASLLGASPQQVIAAATLPVSAERGETA